MASAIEICSLQKSITCLFLNSSDHKRDCSLNILRGNKYSAKKGKQTGANPLALRSSSTAAKAPKATPTGATLSQNPLEHQITLAKTLPSLSVPFFI